jgi:dTDP-4-amino-4,6-dideoxygalactose transaminase
MDAITAIGRRHGLHVIEDVAQACGAIYKGKRLGAIGDFGAFSLNVFKTITAGDGGLLSTHNTTLYERAFAIHDHGARPFRMGVADEGTVLGLNLRMHELTGAVALAQSRKLDQILDQLRSKKRIFKEALSALPGFRFRTIHDQQGECATTLTLIFDSAQVADRVAKAIGSKTLASSGKHYYGNMVQLLNKNMPARHACPFGCEAYPTEVKYVRGMLPQTDDILRRAVSLSVGVSDSYLGTDFGIDVLTDEAAILRKAEEFRALAATVLT